MGHQLAYPAAADGKPPVSKKSHTSQSFAKTRRLSLGAAAFFVAAFAGASTHAQSGPFAGLAGSWSGGGTVTLDDGSVERIRCRAHYNVRAPAMNMSLTCASDAYKFNLAADVVDQGGTISGNWSESNRGVSGNLSGRGGGGTFQVIAEAQGVTANISLRTTGNRQIVSIRSDSTFRAANISLSR